MPSTRAGMLCEEPLGWWASASGPMPREVRPSIPACTPIRHCCAVVYRRLYVVLICSLACSAWGMPRSSMHVWYAACVCVRRICAVAFAKAAVQLAVSTTCPVASLRRKLKSRLTPRQLITLATMWSYSVDLCSYIRTVTTLS